MVQKYAEPLQHTFEKK